MSKKMIRPDWEYIKSGVEGHADEYFCQTCNTWVKAEVSVEAPATERTRQLHRALCVKCRKRLWEHPVNR